MFRTKKDVDRHVQDVMRKVNNENERNLRCYNIAKLYFMLGEYELARRYVSNYLTVREDSASAHKLLGQALENLGQKEKALAEYKCSLELESKQHDLVLKVCELLVDSEASLDIGRARYWCDRAEQLFPHHPTVFRLKEHLLTADGEDDATELEALIASELTARPTDVLLRVRLLRLYLDTERVTDAYNHAVEVESRAVPEFRNNLQWYECLSYVFETYQEEHRDSCNWEFYLHYVAMLERAACLSLSEHQPGALRSIADSVQALFSLDQVLQQASGQTPPASEKDLYQEFLKHYRGLLCLHLATLVLKKAKKENGNWREACRVSAPLLLHALSPPLDIQAPWLLQATETRKKMVELWAKEAAYRNSQAGHVLLSMVRERRSHFLDRVTQFCSGNWRERVFQRIFSTRDHQRAMPKSHFVNFSGFSEPPLRLPTANELLPHDEKSQKLHPNSLHHLVWLGLQDSSGKKYTMRPGPEFCCHVFEGLQLTCNNMNCSGVETLNRLDIDAFLYAAVLCAGAMQEECHAAGYWSSDRPAVLPANITEQLCTANQSKWWSAAYRVYTNQAKRDLGELRQTLQRGIEVVRILGNHGLDVKLIVQLARAFAERASALAARTESSADLPAIEARASLYWTAALPLLERLQRNQAIRAPHTRLFEYQGKELSSAEVNALIEEGKFFLACQLMKEEKYEKAIEAFQQLKSPYASFYQATIYRKLAAEELEDQRREMITSEMRSQHIILLTKARECYYLTLDRLRSPGVDAKHPLNAELNSHIEEIESQLSRIDPDMMMGADVNRNECDGMSDDSVSPVPSAVDHLNNSLAGLGGNSSSLYLQHSSLLHLTPRHRNNSGAQKHSSTPYKSAGHKLESSDIVAEHHRRTEARPSPERLDAQIRHLIHSKETVIQTIMDQNKALLEQNKAMVDALREHKLIMEEIKNQLQELRKDTAKLRRGTGNANTDLSQVCDGEEDLYVFDDEDYTEDVNLAAAQLGQYQAFPPYPPNYPNYRGMSGILGAPAPYPAPHSGTQTPLLPPPPPPPMGGFFRGVDPSAALMYPPTLSYYGQGALPFSEGQQLPDFRSAAAGPQPAPVPPAPIPSSIPPMFSRLGGAGDSPSAPPPPPQGAAPVNVVITSSDTLPTTAPANQPTLSVTIPPQHRLGTPLVAPSFTAAATTSLSTTSSQSASSVPHAFQISMPPQAQKPQASILEKGAATLSPVLPISTGMLLSSVPSPVYSALEKSPVATKEGTGVSPSTAREPRRISTGSTGAAAEEDGEVEEADHDPCPDYKPVIPLPAEIELTTGEEEETVLFESRAKLYRYVDKEWKERGVGNIKLLHNQSTGKVRVLMRREQVLKICANHLLRSDMELTSMNDRAWMWVAHDFADEEVRLEKLCVRFKTADEAANFRDAFEKAKSIALASESPSKPETKPAVEARKETQTTPANIATTSITSAIVTPSTTSPTKITVGGFTFATTPTFKLDSKTTTTTSSSKDSSKDKDKGAGDAAKTSPFAGFSFTSPRTSTSETSSGVAVQNASKSSVPKPVTGVASTPETSKPSTAVTPSAAQQITGTKLMFESPHSNLTFSALASEAKEGAFKKDSNFKGWEGAGKTVFGGSQKRSEMSDENDNENAAEEFVPTAEFKPVVPLPELVETKTGEEGEEVLFEERAKLLRYDSEGKQWKERGIGKLKVMQDPKTGKVRLLMRREQVLKVCCNHFVTATMQFNALSTSDRAWTWYAHDYSEGEVKVELLAVKFKTTDQAQAFKKVLDEVQAKMKTETKEKPQSTNDIWKCGSCLFPNASDENSCRSCMKSRPRPPKPDHSSVSCDQQAKVTELTKSKPKDEAWQCQFCSKHNDGASNKCTSCNKERIVQAFGTPQPKPLSEVFRHKPGSWECRACYVRNEGNAETCTACDSPKPGTKPAAKSPVSFSFGVTPFATDVKQGSKDTTPLSELYKPPSGSWECPGCYTRNEASRTSCVCCTTQKPGLEKTEAPKVTFSFGIPKESDQSNVNLAEMFKPPAGSWECKSCMVRNNKDVSKCVSCGVQKDGTVAHAESAGGFSFLGSSSVTPSSNFSFGTSTTENHKFSFGIPSATTAPSVTSSVPTTKSGFIFGLSTTATGDTSAVTSTTTSSTKPFVFEPKPGSGTFLFGNAAAGSTNTSNNSTLTFSFGESANQDKDQESTSPKEASAEKFTFGSPGKFEFHFSVRPKSPVKSPKSPGVSGTADEDGTDSEAEEDEGEHIYFQPVIPLPDKVPVRTGEEEEDVLYCHVAKLFRFTNKEWKERGVGNFKILKHKTTGKVRLLMRRDQVLKLCLNHYLTPEVQFSQKDEKSWLWSAADFSEGEIQNETFALRFRNKEIAMDFKKAIDDVRSGVAVSSSVSEATSEQDKPPSEQQSSTTLSGSMSQSMKNFSFVTSSATPTTTVTTPTVKFSLNFGNLQESPGASHSIFGGSPSKAAAPTAEKSDDKDELEVVYELNVTAEEKAAALALQLPPNFYAYRNKPGCPGCRGCESDGDDAGTENKKEETGTAASSEKSTSTQSKSEGQKLAKPTLSAPKLGPLFGQQPVTSTSQSSTQSIFGIKPPADKPSTGMLFGTGEKPDVKLETATSTISPIIAAPKLKTNTPVFGQAQVAPSSTASIFGGQTTSPSVFSQTPESSSLFTSIDSTPKTSFAMPSKGLSFTAINSKSDSSQPSGFTFSSSTKPDTMPFNFSSKLGLKPNAASGADPVTSSGFSFTNIETKSETAAATPKSSTPVDTTSKETEGVPFLPLDKKLSFASLASKSEEQPAFKTDNKNFSWANAGAAVFSSKASKDTSKEDAGDGSGDEGVADTSGDATHDPHFEPIIDLPDTIEVRTGEEDEEKMFGQRAKLFRYEAATKEWKERGVGEMKVLHHPVNNTYRLLLRREQVHKVVCNQLITQNLVLNALNTSDRALCWGALNYPEESEPKVEELAVRFKTPEIANDFKDVVTDIINQLKAVTADGEEAGTDKVPETRQEESEASDEDSCEEEEDEDEDEDDDECEKTLMFEKRATLYTMNPQTSGWSMLGLGDLQVEYDPVIYGGRITMEKDGTAEQICNCVIPSTSVLEVKKRDCIWTGVDCIEDSPVQKKFMAKFSSEEAANEFRNVFQEVKKFAENLEIMKTENCESPLLKKEQA